MTGGERAAAPVAPSAPGPPTVPLGLLGAAAFLISADVRVIDPLLPVLAAEFRTDVAGAALTVSAYALPYGLFQLAYGPIGDRVGKPRVMAAAMALFALGTAACALAPTLSVLVLLRFLTGVAAAGLIPLSLAYIGDSYPYAERQAAIARYIGFIALGQIMSASVSGIFADFLTWRAIFGTYGLLSLAVAGVLFRRGWTLPRPAPSLGGSAGGALRASLAPYRVLLRLPNARVVYAAVFVEGFFFIGATAYLGAYLRERFGLQYVVIGLILAGIGVGNLVYSRAVKRLVGSLGEQGLMGAGGALVCACYGAIALLGSWQPFVPIVVVLGLAFVMLHSTLQTKATELLPDARGSALALFAFCLFVGQSLGAAAMGRVITAAGYPPAFALAGAATALLGLWLVRVAPPGRASDAEGAAPAAAR